MLFLFFSLSFLSFYSSPSFSSCYIYQFCILIVMNNNVRESPLQYSDKVKRSLFQKSTVSPLRQQSTACCNNLMPILDRLCNKFQKLFQIQNTRLYRLQSKYGPEIVQKFDQLISVNQRINSNLERMLQNIPSEIKIYKTSSSGSNHLDPKNLTENQKFQTPSQFIRKYSDYQPAFQDRKKQEEYQELAGISENSIGAQDPILKTPLLQTPLLQRVQKKKGVNGIFKDFAANGLSQNQPQSIKEFNKYVGNFYNRSAKYYYDLYTSGRISYDDIKIRFSTDIFNQLIEFQGQWIQYILTLKFEELGKCHTNGKKFYKLFNEASAESLQFLIHKYPPSRANLVDTQLSEKIKEIKHASAVKYDLLKNAKMQFGFVEGQTDFSRQIKLWINKLIIETRKQYPLFKETMKSIFSGNDGSSFDGSHRDNQLQYCIALKIPQNAQLYSQEQINAPDLQVKNPQILRILMKWYQQLIAYFTDTEQKIMQNKFGFKSIHNKSIPIRIPQSKLDLLAQNLKDIYVNEIKELEQKQFFNIGVFIEGLISISLGGLQGHEFLNEREIIVSKMSQCLYEAFKSYLLTFLNLCLEKLVKVRSKYDSQSFQSNIQLITFGVMDILRCKCIGSKQQIYRIYHQITKNTDYFQIIRIKNKLNEPTKDILINLKLKNSFLICQVQLALGSSKQQASADFCHYLYQIQRSKFGVLFQCASQIYNLDPKIQYIKKHPNLTFKKNTQIQQGLMERIRVTDGLECNSCHPYAKMVQVQNTRPLICLSCMSFIPGYFNKLPYYRCMICNFTICHECSVCLAKKSPTMMKLMFNLSLPVGIKLPAEIHYDTFRYPGVYNKVQVQNQILSTISQYHEYAMLVVIDNNDFHYGIFKKYKQRTVETFSTIPQIPQININFNASKIISTIIPLKQFQIKKISSLKEYRKIHIYFPWCKLETIFEANKIEQVVCVLAPEKHICFIIDVIENEGEIEAHKLIRSAQKIVRDCNKYKGDSLEITSKKLTNLDFLNILDNKQSIKSLNLWENSITDLTVLQKFTNIQELYLQDNQIQSIDPILHMSKLQLLSVGHNKIYGSLPQLYLPQLQYLAITDNMFKDISSLSTSNMKSLILLKLTNTHIQKLTKMNFPKLQLIKANNCRINDITEFAESNLPTLLKLNLEDNYICGEIPRFNFPMLNSLRLFNNKIDSMDVFSSSTLPSLSSLNLSHNNISSGLKPIHVRQLLEIDLSFNKLSNILDRVFVNENFPKLQTLLLRHNNFIDQSPIIQLSNLKKLDLGENSLSKISIKLNLHPRLEQLLCDNNKIKRIGIVKHSSLRYLDLSHNQIEDISDLEHWRVVELRQIRFDNNKIVSPVPKMYMTNLEQLNLKNNEIEGEKFMLSLHLIPNIKVINLEGNPEKLKKGIEESYEEEEVSRIIML